MRIIESLREVVEPYEAVFCDIWGCLHNGLTPYPQAVTVLQECRSIGKKVVLVTNAPRPGHEVILQLKALGVPPTTWDAVVSSGDVARAELERGRLGDYVFYLGPERDLKLFSGLPVIRTDLDKADSIVCTGLFQDEIETPEDYRSVLQQACKRKLRMMCANPDLIVDRGTRRLYCAGALAAAYEQMGGEVMHTGKPFSAIYALAAERAELKSRAVLAIGDGPQTDVRGARLQNFDCLFVCGGLEAANTLDSEGRPDPLRLDSWLKSCQEAPAFAIGHLC